MQQKDKKISTQKYALFAYDFSSLKERNKDILLFDVDNTLLFDHANAWDEKAKTLIKKLKTEDFHIVLLSNGSTKRIASLAKEMQLAYLAMAQKPFTRKIEAFFVKENLNKERMVLFGDQWFTDMQCAKNLNIEAVWVEPRSKKERWHIAIKRPLEKLYITFKKS